MLKLVKRSSGAQLINKIMKDKLFLVVFIAICFLIFPRQTEAYLDPGTASFVAQILIAGILALTLSVKTFWQKIKEIIFHFFEFFHRDNGKPK